MTRALPIREPFWPNRLPNRSCRGIAVGSDDERVSEIISFMAACRFDRHWFARFSFDRLVARYDRDADVILLGAGFRF